MQTGSEPSEPVQTEASEVLSRESTQNPSEPLRTSTHPSAPVRSDDPLVISHAERIEHLEGKVKFLREELTDRRQSTTALTDVVEMGRLSAQANALQLGGRRRSEAKRLSIFVEWGFSAEINPSDDRRSGQLSGLACI